MNKKTKILVILLIIIIIILSTYGYSINSQKWDGGNNDNNRNDIVNCSVKISWIGQTATPIQINITNTGNLNISLTTFWSPYNDKIYYDYTLVVINPEGDIISKKCSDWIGSAVMYGTFVLKPQETLNFTSSRLALLRGTFSEQLSKNGTYKIYLVIEDTYESNILQYGEPNLYWEINYSETWIQPEIRMWRDGYQNITVTELIAHEMGVLPDILHIYFYNNISFNSSCDKYVGAVAENNSSIVFRYNSSSNQITHIDYYFLPANENETQAFYLVATGSTNYGNYVGDNLVPVERFTYYDENATDVVGLKYYDGWGFKESYGSIAVNITTNMIRYLCHTL